MPFSPGRLLALALESKQGLHALRLAFAGAALDSDALSRAAARLTSIKSRALAMHADLERERDPEAHTESRRQLGIIWSSTRGAEALLALAHRQLALRPPRPSRIDATWAALKSRFVSGWPRTVLPPPPPAPADHVTTTSVDAQRGRCPVCAGALLGPAHACASCETPHHRACWDYLGGCGIYGCRRR